MPSNEQFLQEHLTAMQTEMRDLRQAVSQIAEALSHLAVLDERHQSLRRDLNEVAGTVKEVAKTVNDMQLEDAKRHGQVTGAMWTAKAIWAVVGGAAAFIFTKIVLPALGL